jgi:hypothetical protein
LKREQIPKVILWVPLLVFAIAALVGLATAPGGSDVRDAFAESTMSGTAETVLIVEYGDDLALVDPKEWDFEGQVLVTITVSVDENCDIVMATHTDDDSDVTYIYVAWNVDYVDYDDMESAMATLENTSDGVSENDDGIATAKALQIGAILLGVGMVGPAAASFGTFAINPSLRRGRLPLVINSSLFLPMWLRHIETAVSWMMALTATIRMKARKSLHQGGISHYAGQLVSATVFVKDRRSARREGGSLLLARFLVLTGLLLLAFVVAGVKTAFAGDAGLVDSNSSGWQLPALALLAVSLTVAGLTLVARRAA